MLNRRKFLKTTALISGACLFDSAEAISRISGRMSANYFSVHPFIEDNPDAVFIMLTDVDVKTNADAIRQAGLQLGQSLLIPTDDSEKGIPTSHTIAIKPNLTGRRVDDQRYTTEGTMGIVTDANFVEGLIESIKGLGIEGNQIYLRNSKGFENLEEGGYAAMAERTGADVQMFYQETVDLYSPELLQWKDVPDGQFFKRLPYFWPINSPDSWLLNVAKFKTHKMGVTLCAKNLQGSIAFPYVRHCYNFGRDMKLLPEDMISDAFNNIQADYDRHVDEGMPRWQVSGTGSDSSLGMETWSTRCLDNNSVTKPGLHIIEGIYGRDGNFIDGPHEDGLARDYMTNLLIFGKNPFYVDIIGHWLAGHEPVNFALFHKAKERGFIDYFNPLSIPLYEWNENGEATLSQLSEFERYELKTLYLRQEGEDEYHLCNEPYDYEATSISRTTRRPESYILLQNYPNPFNPSTTIGFYMPQDGYARLDIIDIRGRIVDVLHDRFTRRGEHMVRWDGQNRPSGTYFYRFRSRSFSETKKMCLIR